MWPPAWQSARLEADVRAAEADDVAVAQRLLAGDADAVDLGAVGGAEVGDDERRAEGSELGVAAADVGIVERDAGIGEATNGDDAVVSGHTFARGQDQRADADAAAGLAHRDAIVNRPGFDASSTSRLTETGPMKW